MTFRTWKRFLLILPLLLALVVLPGASVYAQTADKAQETEPGAQVSGDEKAFLDLLLQVKEIVEKVHPSDVSVKALYEGMLKGLVDSLGDKHSEYLTEAEYVQFTTSLDGTYSGIGVVLQMVDQELTVVSTVKGGPAERAGVKPGDVISSVDGREYSSLNDVAVALRGPAGTSVIIIVNRPSTGEVLSLGLYREVISSSAVEAEDIGGGLYYVRIAQFDAATGMTFANEMARIKGLGAKGLLLDLRDNPGGLLDVGVSVADYLVPKGPIVELQTKENRQVIYGEEATDPIPVVVLVNGRSASASEIVAGAIRDYGVGILVGERTYGKGSIQQVVPLGGGFGAIRLTIAEYFTPSGTTINGAGLEPDIGVKTQMEVPAKLEVARPLRVGAVGLDVLALQKSLSFLGYYGGQADGVFGPRTDQAVRRFLSDQKMNYSGAVSQTEVDVINSAVVAKVSEAKDAVYVRGLQALKSRIESGTWPVQAQ